MAQSDSVAVTVGAHRYQCFKLDPWILNEITHKILNVMGPTIGKVVLSILASGKDPGAVRQDLAEAGGSIGSLLEKQVDLSSVVSGLEEALTRLKAEDSRWLMEQLASQTTIDGGGKLSASFGSHFLGRPLDMYRWALAALKSQYDFFA